MVQNRCIGVGRQQNLPQELEKLEQDIQTGVSAKDSFHKNSPILNPLFRHMKNLSVISKYNTILMDLNHKVGIVVVMSFFSLLT